MPLAATISATVLGLCAYLARLTGGNRWPYAVAAGVIVVAWIVRYAVGGGSNPKAELKQTRVTQGIVSAGAVLAFALLTKLVSHLH